MWHHFSASKELLIIIGKSLHFQFCKSKANGWYKNYKWFLKWSKICLTIHAYTLKCSNTLSMKVVIQDDPNRNFLFQMTITLKLSMSDPMLVLPKCVWKAVGFFSIFEKNFSCLFTIFQKKIPPLKHILTLPTWDQKCLISEL